MIPENIIISPVEPSLESSPLLTEGDLEHLSTLGAPARRAQWSSWRVAIRRVLGREAEVRYNGAGAPILTHPVGSYTHLSVSHTTEHVAVMLAADRCGIDIEQLGRNFSRISSRYIAPSEREQFEAVVGDEFEALWWCAKEAIYKWGSAAGVDFTEQMLITAVDCQRQTLQAELYGVPTPTVHYRILPEIGHLIAWLSTEPEAAR